jgi:hypothetical protein
LEDKGDPIAVMVFRDTFPNNEIDFGKDPDGDAKPKGKRFLDWHKDKWGAWWKGEFNR